MQPIDAKVESRGPVHLASSKPGHTPATPLVFRPTKESLANPDAHSLRTFDFSLMKSSSTPKLHQAQVDIALPHPGSCAGSSPMVPQRHGDVGKTAFSDSGASSLFQAVETEFDVRFSPRARAAVFEAVLGRLTNLVRGAAQESRRRRNYYSRPIAERGYTSCPHIAHHFLAVELYYSSYFQRQVFQDSELYEPVFFAERFDHSNYQVFGQDMVTEYHEEKEQNIRICQTLKARGAMFRTVARENDGKSYIQEVDNFQERWKRQMTPKPAPVYNPKVAEILGRKDLEERRLSTRQITPTDIIAFIEGCSRGARRSIPNVILERKLRARVRQMIETRPAIPPLGELDKRDKILLHNDQRPGTDLRGRVFGHPDSILTFREGLLAKTLGNGEKTFYEAYRRELHQILSPSLVPEILGIVFRNPEMDTELQTGFDFQRSLKVKPGEERTPMLLERDVAAGYARPAILDLKVGIRSWRIGASEKKAKRRSAKMAGGVCAVTNFRVRAGMWYSDNPKWEKDEGLSIVTRDFGNHCTMEELQELFRDFFKYHEMIPSFVEKLEQLRDQLSRLRDVHHVRFYSSSVLIVYDETNPEKMELRMLDFEKSYVGVDKVAEKFHEPIENCEDGVIEAVENIKAMLELIM